jgi:hypothetical protein
LICTLYFTCKQIVGINKHFKHKSNCSPVADIFVSKLLYCFYHHAWQPNMLYTVRKANLHGIDPKHLTWCEIVETEILQYFMKCLITLFFSFNDKYFYNIAFVNSERWLMAKSCVDITQCQHGNVGKFLSLCFFVLYYKTNIKHFPCWYTVISTLVEIGKTRNCVKTLRPLGVVFPHNFSFSQFPLVLIKLYINTENVLYLLNIQYVN